MRHEVIMPRLSETVDEGILVTWFVEPGQLVRAGDRVAEVQVEKMASEVSAPADGRVTELLAAQGDVIAQGATLAVIEGAGAAGVEAIASPAASVLPAGGLPPGGLPPVAASTGGPASPAGVAAPTGGPASPAARRLARELGVDIATVAGSGPGGRVVEADIERAAAVASAVSPAAETPAPATSAPSPAAPAPGPAAPGAGSVAGPGPGWRVEPLPPLRRAIGDRLLASVGTTAQLTITAEADLTDLAAALESATARSGRPHGILGATIRASAVALRDHPALTAAWVADGLAFPDRIDIGCAVALADGLVVPVIRDPASRTIAEIEAEIAVLAARARDGRLAPPDTAGACFSVTNLGAHRIDAFTPLLNPPQAAILGLGRARLRPAVVGGAIVPRRLAVLSLTFDHRVVDGKPAAAFLDELLEILETPDRVLDASS
jgi:pyruvate dehydrogenase E2 component (dihydrolipoamide acetyltransferase)